MLQLVLNWEKFKLPLKIAINGNKLPKFLKNFQKIPKNYEDNNLTKITISTKKLLKVVKIAINWYKLPNVVWCSQNLKKKKYNL